jgi:2-polyprenyl-3-methyl-5-hydroxy-6-metoxy-1,4-benzoquinol methylase
MPRQAPDCPCCATPGEAVYEDLTAAVAGRWTFRRCRACALWWTDPQPLPEEIPSYYADYYTHSSESGTPSRFLRIQEALAARILPFTLGYGRRGVAGAILAAFPLLRDLANSSVLWVPSHPGARLLDVGAGSGAFLRRMKDLGWAVTGVEPDPAAAEGARSRHGLNVLSGGVEQLLSSPERFDVITMSHVLEHVPDPAGLLRSVRSLLQPGGSVVVLTPNAGSLGRRMLGRRWRGLEVPRHLSLFTRRSLADVAGRAGFAVRTLRCPTRSALWMWCASRGGFSAGGLLSGALFQGAEELLSWVWREAGEELLLIATPAI